MRTLHATAHKGCAFAALAALVPAPTFGLVAALYLWPERSLGQIAFAVSKVWLVALPVVWLVLVERGRPRVPPLRAAGMAAGVGTGVAIFSGILAAYALFGDWIDAGAMAARVEAVGLGDPTIYVLGALYWCTVNSIIEEYVWRWFVFTRCEVLLPKVAAVVAAGVLFTLHHVIALAYYFDWRITLLGSLGVFVGGATWSWIYLRWRNIYAAYVSHVFADLAIFGIGWHIVFGGG